MEHTGSYLFSADETADVGIDHHTPVTPEYEQRGIEFTGKIEKGGIEMVVIELELVLKEVCNHIYTT